MKHDRTRSPDHLDRLPAQAIASLDHALRREFARTPSRREHVRMERERMRRFVEMRGRHWSLEER
ncbi:hypothetical protein [Dokdonella sp.]|uniref:hypothetical protein n=1 Tax=Dokdonella sp. TaxID=2291710 RepID=UPI002F3F1DEE